MNYQIILLFNILFIAKSSAEELQAKIVGGTPVGSNDVYPFMATLYEIIGVPQFRCGGTLIGRNIVLTAAHCDMVDYVEIGRYDRSDPFEEDVQGFHVIEKVLHPMYGGNVDEVGQVPDLDHDVMVLLLDGVVKDYEPIILDSGEVDLEEGMDLKVMGWGLTSTEGDESDVLLEADVDLVDRDSCVDSYGSSITENMICAAREGKDACQGDSGGPLIIADEEIIQVGIVSFGYECGLIEYPTVYASVANHFSWIKSYIDLWENLISEAPTIAPSISYAPTTSMNRKSLETPLQGSTTWYGNMFDLQTFDVEVEVHNLYVHMNSNENESIGIFTKAGSYVGYERSASSWENICDVNVMGKDVGVLTPLPRNSIAKPVKISSNSLSAFYVTFTQFTTATFIYATGSQVGNVVIENGELAILEGAANGYPIFAQNVGPRIWNGAIVYTYSTYPSSSPSIPPSSLSVQPSIKTQSQSDAPTQTIKPSISATIKNTMTLSPSNIPSSTTTPRPSLNISEPPSNTPSQLVQSNSPSKISSSDPTILSTSVQPSIKTQSQSDAPTQTIKPSMSPTVKSTMTLSPSNIPTPTTTPRPSLSISEPPSNIPSQLVQSDNPSKISSSDPTILSSSPTQVFHSGSPTKTSQFFQSDSPTMIASDPTILPSSPSQVFQSGSPTLISSSNPTVSSKPTLVRLPTKTLPLVTATPVGGDNISNQSNAYILHKKAYETAIYLMGFISWFYLLF